MIMNIVTAPRRDSLHWTQGTITWDELVLWMLDPATEKEAGGYILGTLTETTKVHSDGTECTAIHRNHEAVQSRDALTLDSDSPGPDFVDRVRALGCRALVHTTYSSTPETPRYRLIIPLSRPVTPAEYAAEVEAVMEAVGRHAFDAGSIQAERFMYRPAASTVFDYDVIQGPVREPSPDPKAVEAVAARLGGKRDPLELPGIVGAFNRVWTDLDALVAQFGLPYEPAGHARWRLTGTTSAPGVSEMTTGLWFSSHESDPAGGRAQSAFDLVRIHCHGADDAGTPDDTALTDLPSYQAMIQVAQADDDARLELMEADFGPDAPRTVLGYDPDSVRDWDVASNLAVRDLADQFLFTTARGWFRWDGTRWSPAKATELVRPIASAVKDLAGEWTAQGRTAQDVGKLLAILDTPKTNRIIDALKAVLLTDADDLDAHPHLLNAANGTVDLRTGELRPHDREDLLTKVTPVAYHPGARHADWDTALTALREDTLDWMHTRIGQAATGHRTPDDVMPILQGGGANGKTTFTGSISAALGEHAAFVSDRVLLSNPGDHPTEMMTLQGARFALLEETPEGQHLNVKRLKSLVGTPTITARRMRQDDETFTATHSLFLTTNYSLNVTETDTGTWRRLAVVQFPFTYSAALSGDGVRTPDPELRQRLEDSPDGQHEAVLAWVVSGAMRWYAEGIPAMPASVVEDTEEWRAESDPIHAYVRDRLTFDPMAVIPSTELFDDFNNWLLANGMRPWSVKTFSARFQGHHEVSTRGVARTYTKLGNRTLSQADPLAPAPDGKFRGWAGVAFVA